jgi:hypothetical protein
MYDIDIKDEIEYAVDYYHAGMPDNIARAITLARCDLRDGPVYLDADGGVVSCFDEGARPLDFPVVCDDIRRWLECVHDLEVEECCEETEEPRYEPIEGSREAVVKALVGADLYPYVI